MKTDTTPRSARAFVDDTGRMEARAAAADSAAHLERQDAFAKAPRPVRREESPSQDDREGVTRAAPETIGTLQPPAAPTGAGARATLRAIEGELLGAFAEREREIRGLFLALVAREHMLLLGPAGTGKSALAHVFCTAIQGATYYQWLLTRFSTPEELFGPVSLDGLKRDKFRRVTTGKLPEAHIAFLDEIFKANSAVLNSLLTALNERGFDNDGGRVHMPLESLVGASNELPDGPELAALYDRFLLRFWTGYTTTPDSFRRLLVGDEPAVSTSISLAEIAAAQDEAARLPITDAAVDELFKLRAEMSTMGVVVSDRRWRKAMKVLRAAAWYDGATEVTPDIFPVLAHVLWDLPDQLPKLTQLVAKFASAELAEAQEIYDSIVQLLGELPPEGAADFAQRVTGITRELKVASEKVAGLVKGTAGKPATQARVTTLRDDLDRRFKDIRRKAATALGL